MKKQIFNLIGLAMIGLLMNACASKNQNSGNSDTKVEVSEQKGNDIRSTVDGINKQVAEINKKCRNIEPKKYDTGIADESDATSTLVHYFYSDNNNNLLKIDARFITEGGTTFYLQNKEIIFVEEMDPVTQSSHYFKDSKWIYGKEFSELSTDTIQKYNAAREKEILQSFDAVMKCYKKL